MSQITLYDTDRSAVGPLKYNFSGIDHGKKIKETVTVN